MQLSGFFFFSYFLFYLGVYSSVITCSSHEAHGRNVRNSLTVGMGFHCSYVPSVTLAMGGSYSDFNQYLSLHRLNSELWKWITD